MREAVKVVGGLDVRSYTTLIKGCVRHGRMDAALGVLGEMRALGLAPNAVSSR